MSGVAVPGPRPSAPTGAGVDEWAILLAGFGGQGVLSAGRFAALAAMDEGREVSWMPSYGPEMRGGTANCAVIIADRPIGSPVIDRPDILIALNGPSFDRFIGAVQSGGLVIVDATLVKSVPMRDDLRFIPIPASAMAAEAGNMTFAGIVLLGCLSAATGCFRAESFEGALRQALPQRHHHLIPAEMDIFAAGAAYARPDFAERCDLPLDLPQRQPTETSEGD